MNRLFRMLAALACAVALSQPAAAQDELVTELAQHHVDITAQFTGQDVLIFGAVSHPGDVVIKVSSPVEKVAISRKAQYGPFWLTSGKYTVDGAPGLVYLLSTRPIEQMMKPAERARYGLSLAGSLDRAKPAGALPAAEDWQSSYLKLKQQDGYYLEQADAVHMVSDKLFSASMALPAKLPLGEYTLTIYSVRDGKVVAQESRSLDVREVRIERWVSDVAFSHSWLFGIAFTLLAMMIGLVLGIILRKGGDD